MTKRLFSVAVAFAMLISCFSFIASAEDLRYEGIIYFQAAEDMLASLEQDAADTTIWDYEDREDQLEVLKDAADAFEDDFTGAGLKVKWEDYCERILTRDNDGVGSQDGNVVNYLKLLDIFYTDDSDLTAEELSVKNEFSAKHLADEYNVEGLSLADSLSKLDDYTHQMGVIISGNKTVLKNYELSDEKKTEYILHGTKALYQIAFNSAPEDMRSSFEFGFLGDDEGKKLIAVMYGKSLTTELATDNISDVMIGYINNNFLAVKNEFGKLIKEDCDENTEEAVFEFLKNTISKAYVESSSANDELKADIIMLFGNPDEANDKGALQIMFETLISSSQNNYGLINTWINLFLRQHVQTSFGGDMATTLAAGVEEDGERVKIKNGSVVFTTEGLDLYGIVANTELLSLGSDYLDLKCYYPNGKINENVTYDSEDGKIKVKYDSEREATYPAYIQLVRKDGSYIETYPVSIRNVKGGGGGSTGGGSSEREQVKLKFDTAGGADIFDEKYSVGEKVDLSVVPTKEGYVFEGWYLDPEFTKPITEIVMEEDTVIYAKWVKDNGIAGGSHPTPDSLNGKDHFAYVIGYPDNTVRPENNITRAEVATIFFRLLTEEVRNSSMTTTNAFVDVTADDWFNTEVSTLASLGIITGRTADTFVPNAPITRAEFATICARFDDSNYSVTDTLSDISGHWAESYIREAAARGWIKGYEDNTFRPERFITRAETMTLINRILNRAPETEADLLDDMAKWSDNPTTAWYYLPVQEATNSHYYEKKNNVYEKWTEIQTGTDWTEY